MSRLSVYWPEELNSPQPANDKPVIYPFPQTTCNASASEFQLDVVSRARIIFQNRRCRDCGYPVVQPVELPDSAVNLNGKAIPGTATLVGFQCRGCHSEWSI